MKVTFSELCYHEAGHAVMRWIRGLDATKTWVLPDGKEAAGTLLADDPEVREAIQSGAIGMVHGTGEHVNADAALHVALAGPVAEARFVLLCRGEGGKFSARLLCRVSRFEDLDLARQVIRGSLLLRYVLSRDRSEVKLVSEASALERNVSQVERMLKMNWSPVAEIAAALHEKWVLTPDAVVSILSRHEIYFSM